MTALPSRSRPRRFAPLGEGSDGAGSGLPILKGVVFDVDGTLCEPQTHMFAEMRSAVSIPPSRDILEHIYALPSDEQETALAAIRAIERRAMASQVPQPGLLTLMNYLSSRAIRKGICTRNFEAPVEHLLGKYLSGHTFDPVVTRDFRPPKPHPAGILHIARSWGLVGGEAARGAEACIMVGDSLDDMTAGYRAGAATVLLVNEVNAHLAEHEHTDLCIWRLDELVGILDRGFVGRTAGGAEESETGRRAEEVLKERKGEM